MIHSTKAWSTVINWEQQKTLHKFKAEIHFVHCQDMKLFDFLARAYNVKCLSWGDEIGVGL